LLSANFEEGTVKDTLERAEALVSMGFEHLIFNVQGLYTPETLKAFTDEIIPALNG
jgi:hypothetical protein